MFTFVKYNSIIKVSGSVYSLFFGIEPREENLRNKA